MAPSDRAAIGRDEVTAYRPVLDAEQIMKYLDEVFPEARTFGLRIERIGEGEIVTRLPFSERFLRPGGTISGPTLMTLGDTTAFFLILAMVGPVGMAVTTHASFEFLRRPLAADLFAHARLLKLGRRLAVCECHIRSDGDPNPVAHATVTYALPPTR
jgi:uncharacterized protein (TIGR00369 family)